MKRSWRLSLLAFCLLVARDSARAAEAIEFRFSMSESMIGKNVTTEEVRQAMSTWAAEVKKQLPNFQSFEIFVTPSHDIAGKLRAGQLDGVVVTPFEYQGLVPLVEGTVLIDESAPEGEDFVLVVHRDSGIKALSDLKGRALTIYDRPKIQIARVWLDNLLGTQKLGRMDGFFSSISNNPKLNLSVLSVFFKKSDACLVSRRSLDTMIEMNPQVGRDLIPLARSPKLVVSILVFRKGCPLDRRKAFEQALQSLKKVPAGQQALALFEGTGAIPSDAAVLRPSLDLIALQERLRSKTGSASGGR